MIDSYSHGNTSQLRRWERVKYNWFCRSSDSPLLTDCPLDVNRLNHHHAKTEEDDSRHDLNARIDIELASIGTSSPNALRLPATFYHCRDCNEFYMTSRLTSRSVTTTRSSASFTDYNKKIQASNSQTDLVTNIRDDKLRLQERLSAISQRRSR